MRKKQIFKGSAFSVIRSGMTPVLFSLAIVLMIAYGLSQTEKSSRAEGLRILEDSIRRAAVTCYAVEGNYPESIMYIEEHYGVSVDRARYIVHYDIFAENIMPDITVLEQPK